MGDLIVGEVNLSDDGPLTKASTVAYLMHSGCGFSEEFFKCVCVCVWVGGLLVDFGSCFFAKIQTLRGVMDFKGVVMGSSLWLEAAVALVVANILCGIRM